MTLNNNCYLHLNIRTSLCHKQVPQTRILSIKTIELFSYSPSYQGCVYRRQKRTYIYIIYIIGGFGFGVTCVLVAREVVTWMLVPGPGVLWTPSHLPPNPPARPGVVIRCWWPGLEVLWTPSSLLLLSLLQGQRGCYLNVGAWSRSVMNPWSCYLGVGGLVKECCELPHQSSTSRSYQAREVVTWEWVAWFRSVLNSLTFYSSPSC